MTLYQTARSQFVGEGSGPVFLSDLSCSGSEQTLLECPHQIFVGSYCSHARDVGLRCERKLYNCGCHKSMSYSLIRSITMHYALPSTHAVYHMLNASSSCAHYETLTHLGR